MTKARIRETDHGITGEFNVEMYDHFQRDFRNKGILATDRIIKSGIDRGIALEIGPGPGYLGLEWLHKTDYTNLTGLEISKDMITMAERNCREYRLEKRAGYILGEAEHMPFKDSSFDAVFSNGSLHEWTDPVLVFNEIFRVLQTGGRFFVSDLRRDVRILVKWFMYSFTKPKEIRPGFLTSLSAAYTIDEVPDLIEKGKFRNIKVSQNPFGLQVAGVK